MPRKKSPLAIIHDKNLYFSIEALALIGKKVALKTLYRYIEENKLTYEEVDGVKYVEANYGITWKRATFEKDTEEIELDAKAEDAKLKRARREKIEKELAILEGSHRPIDELDEAQANFIKTFISVIDAETYKLEEDDRLMVQRWISSAIDKAREVFERYVK
jgi:hypothetical protein